MSNLVLNVKQGDQLPVLEVQLLDGNAPPSGAVPGGTLAKVTLKNRDTGTPLFSLATMTISDANAWKFQYAWSPTDLATPGDYNGEVVVTYVSGKKQRFPEYGYFLVKVGANLA